MRQSEVQGRFLERFSLLYPQFAFRGVRRLPHRTHGPFDLVLRVTLGRSGMALDLLCIALTEGYPEEVQRFVRRLREPPAADLAAQGVPLLVAPYFSPEARELCRREGVACLDLAGNAQLDVPGAYIEISGKPNPHARAKHVRTPFDGKAERIVRRLLLSPDVRWSMRALADAAQVSLGLASMVTTALAREGLVSKGRTGTQLLDRAALLEAWAESYDLRRSQYTIYRSDQSVEALEERLASPSPGDGTPAPCALTLWSGAERLLGQKPLLPRLALYHRVPPARLAEMLALSGERGATYVFVFTPYDESLLWEAAPGPEGGLPVVHPLQLYLDLGAGDDEELRLAQRVRERLLSA